LRKRRGANRKEKGHRIMGLGQNKGVQKGESTSLSRGTFPFFKERASSSASLPDRVDAAGRKGLLFPFPPPLTKIYIKKQTGAAHLHTRQTHGHAHTKKSDLDT